MRNKWSIREERQRATQVSILLILAMLVSVLGACSHERPTGPQYTSASGAVANSSPATSTPSSGPLPPYSYADVVSRATAAVVTIHSQSRARAPQQFPFSNDPFF